MLIDRQTRELWESLYEKYGRPLELSHEGQYLAVSADGRTIVGEDMDDVARRAAEVLGRGIFLYKIGPRTVGKWR